MSVEDNGRKKILDRIKKLLSFDEGNATQGDLQAAAAAVKRILTTHQITMAEVHSHCDEIGENSHGVVDVKTDREWSRLPGWYRYLAMALANGFECRSIVTVRWDDSKDCVIRYVSFLGMESDAKTAALLFDVLLRELGRLADEASDDYGYIGPERSRYRADFICGASDAIEARLVQAGQQVASETGTDLVPMKTSRIDDWAAKRNLGKTKRLEIHADVSALSDGYRAGTKIPLTRGLEEAAVSPPQIRA
jgi:hypothetical protein